MNTRHALISKALRQRYTQVCRKVETLLPGDFNGQEEFVSRVREFVRRNAGSRIVLDQFQISASWLESDFDCLISLAKMACGEDVGSKECSPPFGLDFLQTLRDASRDPNERFRLLTTRYAHPRNFSQPSEEFVREHVLERLMVKDRARLERESSQTIDDDVLLRLNLIAVHSSLTSDLRFLDALNYYFELLSTTAELKSENSWLFVSFLTLYARALRLQSEEIATCA